MLGKPWGAQEGCILWTRGIEWQGEHLGLTNTEETRAVVPLMGKWDEAILIKNSNSQAGATAGSGAQA